jgi:hypothetical protein
MRINTRIGGRIVIIFFTIIIPLSAFAGVQFSKHDLSVSGSPPWGQNYTDQGGNYVTEPCVFCHTPHQGPNPPTNTLLWNRNLPVGVYTIYGPSTTMDATPLNPPNVLSRLCLSCHDGIGAMNVVYNTPGPGSYYAFGVSAGNYDQLGDVYFYQDPPNPFAWYPGKNIGEQYEGGPIGTVELRNDHPVSIQYRDDLDAELRTPTTVGTRTWVINGAVRLPLYGPGPNPMLECPSCHDVHNTVDYPNKGTTEVFFLRSSNEGSQLCMTCHLK